MRTHTTCADRYEQLCQLCPGSQEYRLHYANALFKAGRYEDAEAVCATIESADYEVAKQKLLAAVRFQLDDLVGSRALVDQAPPDDPETLMNQGCILFKVFISLLGV